MTQVINRLRYDDPDFADAFVALTLRLEERDLALSDTVAEIIETTRTQGDAALVDYTQRFDRYSVADMGALTLEPADLRAALARIDADSRQALESAADRIRSFHEHQRADSWEICDALGNRLGQRVRPMHRAGLYVPGGKASYPSSVLMNAIPASVAGVEEVVMTVPAPDGELNDLVLAAASIAGVDRVFTIGGAQAVAALAYGTDSVPRADKIVGPGNRFVAEAKRQLFGVVGIDMVAGPSEILIISDGKTDPEWLAMDLFSQAEHDEQAQAILIAPDRDYLDAVEAAINKQLSQMARESIIRASLANRGALIEVPDLETAFDVSNALGPEHLELALDDAESWLDRVDVAGAIFVGPQSCESLGDYCAGPNHVLPTSGTARFSSPLGVYDFLRRSSVIHCSAAGAKSLAGIASVLARGESLEAHARSAELRGDA